MKAIRVIWRKGFGITLSFSVDLRDGMVRTAEQCLLGNDLLGCLVVLHLTSGNGEKQIDSANGLKGNAYEWPDSSCRRCWQKRRTARVGFASRRRTRL